MRTMRASLFVGALACGCGDRSSDPTCDGRYSMMASDLCNLCSCSNGLWGWTERGCSQQVQEGANCYVLGLGDVDEATHGVQVQCRLLTRTTGPDGAILEAVGYACLRTADGYTWPAEDIDACWYARTDAEHEGDAIDDVSTECVEMRGDLLAAEIFVLRRPESAKLVEAEVTCAPPEPLCPGPPIEDD